MKFLLALILSLMMPSLALAQTGSAKTQSQLNTEIGTTGCTFPTCLYPDNTTGVITPFGLRQGLLDIVASQFNPLSDTYFGSGRPFCNPRAFGALGNGSHDDYSAFQQCNTNLAALGGGTIKPGPGHYCFISGTLVPSQGVYLSDEVTAYSGAIAALAAPVEVDVCGTNATAINFTNSLSGMNGIYVHGFGFGATAPTVIVNPSVASGGIVINNSRIDGGAPPLSVLGGAGANVITNTRVQQSYGGGALVLVQSGFVGVGNVFDTNWPTCLPAAGSLASIQPWAATTAYPLCAIVTATGPDGRTWYIVATNAGTSGGSQPTLQPYLQPINDGSGGTAIVWNLLRPNAPYYDVQCDTGCSDLHEYFTDHSGAADAGLALTNTASGVVPANIYEDGSVFTDNLVNGIFVHDGGRLQITHGRIGRGKMTTSVGILFTNNSAGDDNLVGVDVHSEPIGVSFVAGIAGMYQVTSAQVTASSTAGISVGANINNITITDSNLGTSVYGVNAVGVQLAAGTSDYLIIDNNNYNGVTTAAVSGVATVTGAHNTITTGNTIADTHYQPGNTVFNLNVAPPNPTLVAGAPNGIKTLALDGLNTGYGVQTFNGGIGTNTFIRWDGTGASPLPIQGAGEELGREGFGGGFTTSPLTAIGTRARMAAYSTEAWNSGANGTYLTFWTTQTGTTSTAEKVRVQNDGGLSVGTANLTTDNGNGAIAATSLALTTPLPVSSGGTGTNNLGGTNGCILWDNSGALGCTASVLADGGGDIAITGALTAGAATLTTPLSVASGGTGQSTVAGAQAAFGQAFLSYRATAVNFNNANGTDIATFNITLPTGYAGYTIQRLNIYNCTAAITTAHFGLFDGPGATGNTLIANTTGTITAQGPVTAASLQQVQGSTLTAWYNSSTLRLNLITQQGSAVTCGVTLALFLF